MTPEGYTRVYVGGLNDNIKKEDLQMQFEKFGKLNKVWVAFNPPGFAFIEFMNMTEAETACSSLNGTDLMGAKLRVEISRGRGRSGGRGGGGGFRDRGSRFGGSSGSGGGSYRSNNIYGSQSGGYYGGRAGGSSRSRYGDDGYSQSSYSSRDSYSQSYGSMPENGSSYGYSSKSYGSSRYRSRSPVARDRSNLRVVG